MGFTKGADHGRRVRWTGAQKKGGTESVFEREHTGQRKGKRGIWGGESKNTLPLLEQSLFRGFKTLHCKKECGLTTQVEGFIEDLH